MKMLMIATAAGLGCLTLAGCGVPAVDGKWCSAEDSQSKDFMVFEKGVIKGSNGQEGTYTGSGASFVARQPDGQEFKMTLSADAATADMVAPNGHSMKMKRCPS